MPYVVECLYLNSAFRGQKFVNYTELEIKQLLYSTTEQRHIHSVETKRQGIQFKYTCKRQKNFAV